MTEDIEYWRRKAEAAEARVRELEKALEEPPYGRRYTHRAS
jgi:hypothetical protein